MLVDSNERQTQFRTPLRVGLVVDSLQSSKYVYELTQWASAQDDVDFSHLLVLRRPAQDFKQRLVGALSKGIYRALSEVFFKLLGKCEQILIEQHPLHHDHLTTFHLDRIIGSQLEIKPVVSRSGLAYGFLAEDIEAVRRLNLDLLIRCAGGLLLGEILNSARLGVISFHHADSSVTPGGTAGFWETFYRSEKTGFALQKLTEQLDARLVLVRGAFTTQFFWLLNQAHLYKKSNEHLKTFLKTTAACGNLPRSQESVPYSVGIDRSPQLHQAVAYACKVLYRIALKVAKRAVGLRQRWSVSFVHTGWQNAVLWRNKTIPNPPGRFLADPFLHEREGKTYCFVEDYVYKTGKGRISVFEIRRDDAVEIGVCLAEPFHLSFPYLFEYNDALYMCPEAYQSEQIRVYKCTEFPLKWELASVLMENVSAADTMLFRHGGKWWMLTNIDKSGIGDHCAELYLFFAESPLDDTWTAHPCNPIYIDSEIARNAGLFIDNAKLFRAAQRQGFDAYGKGFSIFEITKLTETEYTEKRIVSVEPDVRRRLQGTHHISTTGTTTVIDQLSTSFVR